MRTNIVLDDELLEEATRYSRSKTKRAVVEEALRAFVQLKQDQARAEGYRERLKEVRRRLSGLRPQESSRDLVRRDRDRS